MIYRFGRFELDLARAEQELLAAQQALETLRDAEAGAQRIAQAEFDLANLEQQIASRQEELDDENALAEPDALLVSRDVYARGVNGFLAGLP